MIPWSRERIEALQKLYYEAGHNLTVIISYIDYGTVVRTTDPHVFAQATLTVNELNIHSPTAPTPDQTCYLRLVASEDTDASVLLVVSSNTDTIAKLSQRFGGRAYHGRSWTNDEAYPVREVLLYLACEIGVDVILLIEELNTKT